MKPLTLLLFLLCLPGPARAQVLEVCASCPLPTVAAGLEQAAPYDTVWVRSGVYRESGLRIEKPLTLMGEAGAVIDGEHQGEIMQVASDSVSVLGLHLRNVGVSYTQDHAALRVIKSKYFRLENLKLEGLFFGIYLEKSSQGQVCNNQILGDAKEEFNSGNGIQLWYCQDVEVSGNTVHRVRDGIYLEFSDRIQIAGNISSGNVRYGLHFMFSNHDTYTNNLFEDNGAGVAVMFSKDIEMVGNTFRKNWGTASFGLLLKEINDARIAGNRFEENTVGISIEGSNRIEYLNNDFRANGWAIKVRGACYTNLFSGNNFMHNSFDVSYNSKVNDNRFEGNYWSAYSGYDLDRNGYGDVPHRPVKLFSYIVNRTPETLVLLRSPFMDLIDFSERVSPVFTPDNLLDPEPLIRPRP
ncbi:nitrous oxide reductase family maturation protein NosD [Robiginitalea sp. M366]|uniref:nitrous oxide reductase family maturation protein NosD n=1 Tax=Robiginitalea aestuariiviva TaxID=3036903 RepID=UPI00240E9A4F|nr:nitrous oxide reductase family maturation protein NosD [Robiginitalea aestuariiviva]MDG1573324.1 nitrous oxide reductase family maturation protein NosD [Robiginitalea aestuariiviva]